MKPETCSTCGLGPCPTPQACQRGQDDEQPATGREVACFWFGVLAGIGVLLSVLLLLLP